MAVAVALLFLVFVGTVASGNRQSRKGAGKAKVERSYTRPAIRKPVKPVVPGVNRYQSDKIFLEYADSLYRLPMAYGDTLEYQILKGNVKFRQAGMWMYCDSAYYYAQSNSMDAFGHVRMEQGDTLFVYADKLFYDGDTRLARLRCGLSEPKVRLINRNVTLSTDSLDYDLNEERGWYDRGGRIDDDVNTLTSIYGEYSPSTKNADFYFEVVLTNNRDGFVMLTDTLYYNTDTHLARIVSPTKILGENDTILTKRGVYDTQSGNAELISRSTIVHRDSNNNVTTLEGDSILYDKATRISRVYMFRDPSKHPAPMLLTDTTNRMILTGGFGLYNDSTKEALATHYPRLVEYSQADTLFLRADTIKTFIYKRMVWPEGMECDSLQPEVLATVADSLSAPGVAARDSSLMVPKEFHAALAYNNARFFRTDMQGVADTLFFNERDSMLYMFRKPVVWSGERQVFGNRIDVHLNDSTVDWALLPAGGMMIEHVEEDFYNQLTGRKMLARFENKELKRLDVDGNVETIFLPMENDSTYNRMVKAESSFLTVEMDGKDMKRLKMWPEVSGDVTPLFLVKRADQFLQKFIWLEPIRPVREWYGGGVRWADNLGDIPDEMRQYFSTPPIFTQSQDVSVPDLPEIPASGFVSVPDEPAEVPAEATVDVKEEDESEAAAEVPAQEPAEPVSEPEKTLEPDVERE